MLKWALLELLDMIPIFFVTLLLIPVYVLIFIFEFMIDWLAKPRE
jgi:hypothetical protein